MALYNACVVEGNFDKGRRIMSAMLPLMHVLEQGGKFIQTIKHGVTMNGFDAGVMRAPLRGLNKDDKRALEQVTRVLKRKIADIVAALCYGATYDPRFRERAGADGFGDYSHNSCFWKPLREQQYVSKRKRKGYFLKGLRTIDYRTR